MAEVKDNLNLGGAVPPQSVLSASLDDKGRLKVPEIFQAYLRENGISKLFITTVDLRVGRVYPMPLWLDNLKKLQNAGEHAAAAGRMLFLARVHGAEDEVDSAGRLLLPAMLREALELNQRQQVYLEIHNGFINVMNKRVYDERLAASRTHAADDLKTVESIGFI